MRFVSEFHGNGGFAQERPLRPFPPLEHRQTTECVRLIVHVPDQDFELGLITAGAIPSPKEKHFFEERPANDTYQLERML
jgi:hypothetical protein